MKKNFIYITLFTTLIILIFLNKDIVTLSCIESIKLWKTKVFASLFIMFIMQDLLISYNAGSILSIILHNSFSKLFGLSTNGQLAFTLSLISGSPVNACTISTMYEEKKLSYEEANHLLKYTYYANPLFLYTMNMLIFNNLFTTIKIIIILYLSNFIYAFATRKNSFKSTYYVYNKLPIFPKVLNESIKKSINTLIMILGTITFFMIIKNITILYFDNKLIITIISGLLELTSGLDSLIHLNINNNLKELLTIIIISFGGLSIHLQVYSFLIEKKLKYLSFLKGRLYITIIAVLLMLIL